MTCDRRSKILILAVTAALAIAALVGCAPRQTQDENVVNDNNENAADVSFENAAQATGNENAKPEREVQPAQNTQTPEGKTVFEGWFATVIPEGWKYSDSWGMFCEEDSREYVEFVDDDGDGVLDEPLEEEWDNIAQRELGESPSANFWDGIVEYDNPMPVDEDAIEDDAPYDLYGDSAIFDYAEEFYGSGPETLVQATLAQDPRVEVYLDTYEDFPVSNAAERVPYIVSGIKGQEGYLRIAERCQVETSELDAAGFHWNVVTEKLDDVVIAQLLVTDTPQHQAITIWIVSGDATEPWAKTIIDNFELMPGDPMANYEAYEEALYAAWEDAHQDSDEEVVVELDDSDALDEFDDISEDEAFDDSDEMYEDEELDDDAEDSKATSV